MNNNKQTIILVGIQDGDEVGHVKSFSNPTWAIKYGQAAGEFARYATVEVEFTNVPVAPRVVKEAKNLSEATQG